MEVDTKARRCGDMSSARGLSLMLLLLGLHRVATSLEIPPEAGGDRASDRTRGPREVEQGAGREEESSGGVQEVRIGFLVGRQRATWDQSYSRPGRQLMRVFNYAIDKINRSDSGRPSGPAGGESSNQSTTTTPIADRRKVQERRGTVRSIRFEPMLGETFGNESESVKRTIELIQLGRASVLVGPQESCQLEPRLAAIFDVPMVSHFCAQPAGLAYASGGGSPATAGSTFVQTKPPHWKIVRPVVALVERLLAAGYPQHLVLLYFKPDKHNYGRGQDKGPGATGGGPWPAEAGPLALNYVTGAQRERNGNHLGAANEAIQYKLIGELLEFKLGQLLEDPPPADGRRFTAGGPTNGANGSGASRPAGNRQLTILNWHTTFHYGYTRNPFRALIRRHLFQAAANQSAADGCANQRRGRRPQQPAGRKASEAIYILVGHYYEHLGLMLALDELGLLGLGRRPSVASASAPTTSHFGAKGPVVVGVDIEPHDERDDSVRFLRGLLLDNQLGAAAANQRSSGNSLAASYSHYLGVMPSKPLRMDELLEEMRQFYNRTLAAGLLQAATTGGPNNSIAADQSVQLTSRLLQFIRLPAEAFYLLDAIVLLADYFSECLLQLQLPLEQCQSGRRVFQWFQGRHYRTEMDHSRAKFDEFASAEGSYSLIALRYKDNDANADADTDSINEDDFELSPVGRFVADDHQAEGLGLDFRLDAAGIGPVWLPLWCLSQSNWSALADCRRRHWLDGTHDHRDAGRPLPVLLWLLPMGLLAAVCLFLLAMLSCQSKDNQLKDCFRLNQQHEATESWFSERDERNFLLIVQNLLLMSETFEASDFSGIPSDQEPGDRSISLLDLHCNMFSFPSCKFVHWLQALHQLKEMLFKFQQQAPIGSGAEAPELSSDWLASLLRCAPGAGQSKAQAISSSRAFFTSCHRGSGSLKLLLNKYKALNECLCQLRQLNHPALVQLVGITLGASFASAARPVARLVLESGERSDLRTVLGHLASNRSLNVESSEQFKPPLVRTLLADLLDGMDYLHNQPAHELSFHGDLRATTCLVSSDWRLKITGFQANHLRRSLGAYEQHPAGCSRPDLDQELAHLAPEVLGQLNMRCSLDVELLKLADVYSLGLLVYELLLGSPEAWWSALTRVRSNRLLAERVKVDPSFRPPLERLDEIAERLFNGGLQQQSGRQSPPAASSRVSERLDSSYGAPVAPHLESLKRLLAACWAHSAKDRPQSVRSLRASLEFILLRNREGSQVSELYVRLVEKSSFERRQSLASERLKSDRLMATLLPERLMTRLSSDSRPATGCRERAIKSTCEQFACMSICLFRFIILPPPSQDNNQMPGSHFNPIPLLNELLHQLDELISSYRERLHLLESQVDSMLRYLVYPSDPLHEEALSAPAGKPGRADAYCHSRLTASFALHLIDLANRWQCRPGAGSVQVRCALHCGPIQGGLLACSNSTLGAHHRDRSSDVTTRLLELPRYALIGPTLQLADLLEQTSQPQRIHISSDYRDQLLGASSSADGNQANHSASKLLPFLSNILADDSERSSASQQLDFMSNLEPATQSFVMIKRSGNRIQVKNSTLAGDLETYWLLNGPRLTRSQRLMLTSGAPSGGRVGDPS